APTRAHCAASPLHVRLLVSPGTTIGERDADLPHRLGDLRVNLVLRPRAGRARLSAAPLVERLRHLRAAGVPDAHEEHARQLGHHATVRSAVARTPSGFGAPPKANASCSTASGTRR